MSDLVAYKLVNACLEQIRLVLSLIISNHTISLYHSLDKNVVAWFKTNGIGIIFTGINTNIIPACYCWKIVVYDTNSQVSIALKNITQRIIIENSKANNVLRIDLIKWPFITSNMINDVIKCLSHLSISNKLILDALDQPILYIGDNTLPVIPCLTIMPSISKHIVKIELHTNKKKFVSNKSKQVISEKWMDELVLNGIGHSIIQDLINAKHGKIYVHSVSVYTEYLQSIIDSITI